MAIRIVECFFSSLAWGISHFFTDTQLTTERMKEKKNKQSCAWVSSKRKKGEVGDTFVELFMHLQAIARVYSRKTSTKPLGMLTDLLGLVNTASVGQQVQTVDFLTSPDCSLPPSVFFSWLTSFCLLPPADNLETFLLSSSFGLVGDLPCKRLAWVSRQNIQRVPWLAPTPTETNATHRVTEAPAGALGNAEKAFIAIALRF